MKTHQLLTSTGPHTTLCLRETEEDRQVISVYICVCVELICYIDKIQKQLSQLIVASYRKDVCVCRVDQQLRRQGKQLHLS